MVRFGARLLAALAILAALGGVRGGQAVQPAGVVQSPGDNIGWDGRFDALGVRSAGGAGKSGSVRAFAGTATHLYAGGIFEQAGAVSAKNIAAWDGSGWAPLGGGIAGIVNALAVSGPTLYVGGEIWQAGGTAVSGIAAWNGTAWSSVTQGVTSTNGGLASVNALLVVGDSLYVAGQFDYAGGVASRNLARWDGQSWSALGGGVAGQIQALAWDGANLYIGGHFDYAGGQSIRNLARWDGQSWSALGSGARIGETVYALTFDGGQLYAGGTFRDLGTDSGAGIARWDGQRWLPVGDGLGATGPWSGIPTYVAAIAVRDGALYVGGHFGSVINGDGASVATSGIARWDGQRWEGLGAGAGPAVFALANRPDGLYVGGEIGAAGGKPSLGMGRWAPPLRTYLPLAGR